MTSQINPNNIDGAYPVAGQDNNSQGFRDNFTNTVNNFTYAAAELTDLQTYALLAAPLASVGQTSTEQNNTINLIECKKYCSGKHIIIIYIKIK